MSAPSPNPDQNAIRDAACIILIDGTASSSRILMGRRRVDQIFLPDKWVFPGGRVDTCDRECPADERFTGLPPWLRPFAGAAIRELQEETGLQWRPSINDGGLFPLARAITPPGRVRRYDTWFFRANAGDAAAMPFSGDGELLDLAWFTLDDARRLDVPIITRLVLEEAARLIAAPATAACDRAPFYFQGARGFERAFVACGPVAAPP